VSGVGLVVPTAGEVDDVETPINEEREQVRYDRPFGIDVGGGERLGPEHDVPAFEGQSLGEARVGLEVRDVDLLLVAVVAVDRRPVGPAIGQLLGREGRRNDRVRRGGFERNVEFLGSQSLDVGGDVVVGEVDRWDPAGLRGEQTHRVASRQRDVALGCPEGELGRSQRDAELPAQRIVEVPSQDYVIEIQFPSQRDRPALPARRRSQRYVLESAPEATEEGWIGR
jgi:hypothetical protein